MRFKRLWLTFGIAVLAIQAWGAGVVRIPRFGDAGSRVASQPVVPAQPVGPGDARLQQLATAPLAFEPAANGGAVSRGRGYAFSFDRSRLRMFLTGEKRGSRVDMRWLGGNRDAQPRLESPLPTLSNYFLGRDPAQWRRDVPNYAKLRYSNLWPGIDLVFYGNQSRIEYDLVVAPGADPSVVRFRLDGAAKSSLSAEGDLEIATAAGTLIQHRPRIYQRDRQGVEHEIQGRYLLAGNHEIRFAVDRYDRNVALVIDPVLDYSTFLGGTGTDYSFSVAVDPAGNAYVAGITYSADLPVTASAAVRNYRGNGDVFVAKVDPSGTRFLYVSYFGGSGTDWAWGVATDSSGNAYVAGSTSSVDMPTQNALQASYGGGAQDAFLFKLNPAGDRLLYSTYFGGSDQEDCYALAVDRDQNVYLTGATWSTNLRVVNAAQSVNNGGLDGFLAKIGPSGNQLLYSTYWGGSRGDGFSSVDVDPSGNVVVGGGTASLNFPTRNALQPSAGGGGDDVTVVRFDPQGRVIYSTYIGGSDVEEAFRVISGPNGDAYLTGLTYSNNYPTSQGAFRRSRTGGWDAFVTRLNSAGSMVFSTYLGGSGDEYGFGIALDTNGNVLVTGDTGSSDFPITSSAIQRDNAGGGYDAFLAKLRPDGTGLLDSTFFGGNGSDESYQVVVDANGAIYLSGVTSSNNFPLVGRSPQSVNRGNTDAWVARLVDPVNCQFTLSSSSLVTGPAALTTSVDLTASAASCTWTAATSSADWLTLSSSSTGKGSGTLKIQIAAYPGAGTDTSRTGYITVAGLKFQVVQTRPACDVLPYPNTSTLPNSAETRAITLASSPAGASCSWQAASDQNWLKITSSTSGTGDGTLTFIADANTGQDVRTANITINGRADRRIAISQAAGGCTLALSSTQTGLNSTGGIGSFRVVATGKDCSWTASRVDPWIGIRSGDSGTGNGIVTFTVGNNGDATGRFGGVLVNAQRYGVAQLGACEASSVKAGSGSNCATPPSATTPGDVESNSRKNPGRASVYCDSLTVSPSSLTFPAAGGTQKVTLTGDKSVCFPVNALLTDATVASVQGGTTISSGTTSASVTIQVSPSKDGKAIDAAVVFSASGAPKSAPLTVTRMPSVPCNYVLNPVNVNQVAAQGGAGAVAVNAGDTCNWTAAPNPTDWIQVATTSGTGTGQISYAVKPNSSAAARKGYIQVNGEDSVPVEQAGAACTVGLGGNQTLAIPAAGSSVTLRVQANDSSCPWTAASSATWIQPAATSGNGASDLVITLTANTSTSTRSGTLKVGSDTITFNQDPAPPVTCQYVLAPGPVSFPAAGGNGTFDIVTGNACPWTVTKNTADTWVLITSPTSGTGSTTVRYTVARNSSPAGRTANFSVQGQTLAITQLGTGPAASLSVSPNPVTSCNPNGATVTLAWTAVGVTSLEIRIQGGASLGTVSSSGTQTVDGVKDGTTFLLVTGSGDVLARATVSVSCKPVLTATPNPITQCTADGLGHTTLNWSAPGTSNLEIRVNAVDGASMGNVDPEGTTDTGDWVSDGMTFFLVTGGTSLAQVKVGVQCPPAKPPTVVPSGDLVEGNLTDWQTAFTLDSSPASGSVFNETVAYVSGKGSFVAISSGANGVSFSYPAVPRALLDISKFKTLSLWVAVDTPLRSDSPQIVLTSAQGAVTLSPAQAVAIGQNWTNLQIPLAGSAAWTFTQTGNFDASAVTSIQLVFGTQNAGFGLLLDGVTFSN